MSRRCVSVAVDNNAINKMALNITKLTDLVMKMQQPGGYISIVMSTLSSKLKDPGRFTIRCTIRNQYIARALCDLSSNINLTHLSIFRKFGIEATHTTIALQFAGQSISHPEEKIENVLVQVEKFIFQTDFIILDSVTDKDVLIILDIPFLALTRTLVDVHKGELIMRLNDQHITFNILQCNDNIECYVVGIIEGTKQGPLDECWIMSSGHMMKHYGCNIS
ncbi:uncharacterized protein LOC120195620 [Hibiscus syriacus]|uniref:uncharacterized protein LOC120195620 n=1 Tax=Hibiscus syriacus TaxID=106335 RepID=UPI001924264B|nr:uncharacterized protein LOC120195620 [Hibiscus syriacus]